MKPAETSEVKVVKAEPLKPAKKTAKKKKKPSTDEPERPEYVIPEEWNWFSKPLTMKNIGSGWVMTAEETVDSSVQAAAKAQTEAVDKESEITAESAAIEDAEPEAKQPEKSEEKASETIAQKAESVVPQNLVKSVQEVPAPVSSQLAPFERALAKMAARKSKRNAEAARLSVTLPSGGGESRKVPGSLLKMIDTLGQMAGSTQGQLHNAADKASHVNESLRDATPAADEGVAPAEKDATSGPVAR